MLKKVIRRVKKVFNPPPAFIPVSSSFLGSQEYEELMTKHLPFPNSYGLHEAQNRTSSFRFRHHEVNHKLGVFRWRGIYRHKDLILGLIQNSENLIVDLGGAASPLGLGSVIVDFLESDAYGNKVSYKFLKEIEQPISVVFTSHTLEHIPELEEVVKEVAERLSPGGHFIVHVPSFYCVRWRHGVHSNKIYNDHYWTFGLSGSEIPDSLENYLEIDQLLGKYFQIELAEYCGDDSIFILCEKRSE